jgi:hypothetical protein
MSQEKDCCHTTVLSGGTRFTRTLHNWSTSDNQSTSDGNKFMLHPGQEAATIRVLETANFEDGQPQVISLGSKTIIFHLTDTKEWIANYSSIFGHPSEAVNYGAAGDLTLAIGFDTFQIIQISNNKCLQHTTCRHHPMCAFARDMGLMDNTEGSSYCICETGLNFVAVKARDDCK